jgi:hypothetical protein
MKSSQWIGALLVLVVMVFVITFAMNFITPATKPAVVPTGPPPVTEQVLQFAYTTLPPLTEDPKDADKVAIYREEKKEGFLDFLFENTGDKDVKIGLIGKNCKCASVQLVVAKPEWRNDQAALLVSDGIAPLAALNTAVPGPLSLAAQVFMPGKMAHLLHDLEHSLPALATLDPSQDQVAVVPARAVGWIRLQWDNSKTGLQRFLADIWVDSPTSGQNYKLQAEVRFVAPVKVAFTDLRTPELNEAALEKKPFRGMFKVWSPTRPGLKLTTKILPLPRFDALGFDPLEVGEPIPLTLEETTELKKAMIETSTVVAAYRIPIMLKGRSPDGKVAVDLGSFRRRFFLTSDADDGREPMEMTVTGSVRGSILIGSAEDGGRVSLGLFDSHSGSPEQLIVITGESADVALEIDNNRTAEFLRDGVKLEQIAPVAGLPRWKLKVQVRPDAAQGNFPRGEDKMYQDSAVYLTVKVKGKGDVVQSARVPVDGTANTR